MKPKALLSWSSGKDSAWTLHVLRQKNEVEVAGLLTTFNEEFDRVAMHAVRRELVEAQADAAALPLWPVPLPWPCSNEQYERIMEKVLAQAKNQDITRIAFGDLYLTDIRAYRERQLAGTGIDPLFPIWCSKERTQTLAQEMIDAGLKAIITCVDPKQLDPRFVGRAFDAELLSDLPGGVDRCGENGEFHTFCNDGPMFRGPIPIEVGENVERDGFQFADVRPSVR